ncbi:alpha/beta hydrolase [Dyadobacter tibetensis]|uniref:alpha/beta hydrolase n=1 Tax=Dyadobacter tibetensis TaxID=1211851 RepID=UPI00046F1BE8|nr:alpha/beta hydrolase family protein [Dyadobacter tibetensis]
MTLRSTFSLTLLLIFFNIPFGKTAQIDTITTYSKAMKKEIKAVVITPDSYNKKGPKLPVVYLLHGYSDRYDGWLKKGKGFEIAADTHQIIIVCPDGNVSSWYWDSPVDPEWQYETYVSLELPAQIDQHYNTIPKREGRAITGLSMGGHGALFLAIRHQDVFGAAGSMSGGVDIRPFPKNWEMSKKLGTYAENPSRWEQHTVMNQLHLLVPNGLALIIDCGVDDFFFAVNEKLHQELRYRNIPHDYISRPGSHTWPYWKNALQYQMLFMRNYFDQHSQSQ